MYSLTVNEKYYFNLFKNNEEVQVNGKITNADIRKRPGDTWHVINNLQSYNIEVINFNKADKTARIKVNNNIYTVWAKDESDILLDRLGLSNLNRAKMSDVKAPMPGLVLKIFVTEGMQVKKDENLFVLEAMKMENIIKAPADLIVKILKIKPGDKVEKNQVLLTF